MSEAAIAALITGVCGIVAAFVTGWFIYRQGRISAASSRSTTSGAQSNSFAPASIGATPKVTSHSESALPARSVFLELDRRSPGISARLRDFLEQLKAEHSGITWDEMTNSIHLKMLAGARRITAIYIDGNGAVDISRTPTSEITSIPNYEQAMEKFAQALQTAVPGTITLKSPTRWKRNQSDFVKIWELLEKKDALRDALNDLKHTMGRASS